MTPTAPAPCCSPSRPAWTAEDLIEGVRREHVRDLTGFGIEYDNYHSTHSEENRTLSELIFERLRERGCIFTRDVAQLYDPERGLFLADRFVKGDCPRCGAADQYGDNCDVCGATYDATELGRPRSLVSGVEPEIRQSEHYFFDLPQFGDMLKGWTRSGAVQPEVANKLAEWLDEGLKPWDISRDAPYFGFLIPGTQDKYFYVWMDAPVGYMASFKNLADARDDLDFDAFWAAGADTELHHFIGKDIINFHTLFWPAVLEGAGFRKPTRVHTHGFLTVEGAKMSKSKGTFILASTYLEHLNPECLRYYFATKLNGTVDDYDFNSDDFVQRVNADLVGKVVNIASRCAGFITRNADGELALELADEALWRPLGRCFRIHRRTLRGGTGLEGGAGDHRLGRPSQPIHRRARTLEAGQAGRHGGRGAGGVQPGVEPVPHPRHLPDAHPARPGRRRSPHSSMWARCAGPTSINRCLAGASTHTRRC